MLAGLRTLIHMRQRAGSMRAIDLLRQEVLGAKPCDGANGHGAAVDLPACARSPAQPARID
jgi:hypothetical protein